MKKTYKKNYGLIVLCSLVFSFFGFGQKSELGNWLIYFGNKQIDSTWNWHSEIQYRNYNALGNLEQLMLRTGIGYNLSKKNNNLLLGYGFIASENYIPNTTNKKNLNEHRIYQQFITKQKIGAITLSHRYRFEQRFVTDKFKMRFRYFLSLNIPFCKKDDAVKWYASAYNEIFLNTKSNIFDRNRLYGGLGYKLNKKIRFELGYMNQFFEASGRDQINVVSFINF